MNPDINTRVLIAHLAHSASMSIGIYNYRKFLSNEAIVTFSTPIKTCPTCGQTI